MKKIEVVCVLFIHLFLSCTNVNERDIKLMHLNGDVVKIETVSLTSVPIMEMSMNNNPKRCIAVAEGNYILTFNRRGNIIRYQGFGIDNEELFDVSPIRGKKIIAPVSIGNISISNNPDSVHFEQNEDGELVVIELFKNNKLSNRIHIFYDQFHRPIMYVNDKSFVGSDIFLQTDTNLYRYLDNDKYGNWTKLEIEYRSSHYPEQNHVVYSVLRQITYRGEREKEPLIKQSIVNDYMVKRNQFTIHEQNPISLGIASISIPNYMVPSDTKNYLSQTNRHISLFDNDLCRYTYKDKSKYASFSIQYTPNKGIGLDEMTDEERVFNKEVDNEFRKQYEDPEIQQDLALLIWYPYDFVNINNHWALRQRYIRYGNGAWVPVYVESYLMDTPDGGAITITMSYQITQRQYFHQDFTNSVLTFQYIFN